MPRPNNGPRLKLRRQKGAKPVYEIVWYEGGRRRTRSTGTRTYKEAETALAKFILKRRMKNEAQVPCERKILEVLMLYVEERGPKVKSRERLAYAVEALFSYWKGKCVSDIDEGTCAEYYRFRGVADSTLRRELGTLRAAINHDVAKRRLSEGVTVFMPEKPPSKKRFLTREEPAQLLREARKLPKARKHLVLFILLGLYTGARKEAILGLKWSQVDFEGRWIDFAREDGAQTKKLRARPPIVSRLLPFLRAAKRRSGGSEFVITFGGEPLADVRKSFGTARKSAGLKDVLPHTLRHTAITWLLRSRVSVWSVSGFVGASPETIQKVYGHHSPDYLSEAREALESGGKKTVRNRYFPEVA